MGKFIFVNILFTFYDMPTWKVGSSPQEQKIALARGQGSEGA
jgi:hypothetical protein